MGLALVGAPCLAPRAVASGFAMREGSTDWLATSFAGDTAKAYDAATAWANPAGMVRLEHSEVDQAINGVFPTTNFSDSYSGIRGTTGGNLTEAIATGGLYAVWHVNDAFRLGLAVDTPFGQRISNPDNFVGRYQSLVSSITDEAILLSAAYRLNEHWSIGGGPVVDLFAARMTNAILTPAAAYGDPQADIHGTDTAVGFNIGALYQVSPLLRFGIDYRSRIQHNINGYQSVGVPAAYSALPGGNLLVAALDAQNSPASTSVTLPDSLTLGMYWQATKQLAVMADVGWTNWSLLKALIVVPSSRVASQTVMPENWRATYSISVGANYRFNDTVLLQAGAGYDQSPVTNATRTPGIPDSNRYMLSVGMQYAILRNATLQGAYQHVFFEPGSVTQNARGSVLIGRYAGAADTFSLGMKYRF